MRLPHCSARPACLAVVAAAAALAPSALGQSCNHNTWRSPALVPTYAGWVIDLEMWDPDGPGFAPAAIVMSGIIPGGPNEVIGYWDGAAWVTLDRAAVRNARGLAVLPDGTLIAGATFRQPNGVFVDGVSRWTGTAWELMGGAFNGLVQHVDATPQGEIVVAGGFTSVGGVSARHVARWDGTAWVGLGGGITDSGSPGLDPRVDHLVALSGGRAAVAGLIGATADGPAGQFAYFDGTQWQNMGMPTPAGVRTVGRAPSGDLVVGGNFTSIGGVAVPRLARWTGTTWAAVAPGVPMGVGALDFAADGRLLISDGGRGARWDGTAWEGPGPFITEFRGLMALPSGDAAVWGMFSSANGINAHGIGRFEGGQFRSIQAGVPVRPLAMTVDAAGLAVLAGEPCPGCVPGTVVRYDGRDSTVLGSFNQKTYALATMANGDIVVGGAFTNMTAPYGFLNVNKLARLSSTGGGGGTWTALGSGVATSNHEVAEVFALAVTPSSELIAGGRFDTAGGGAAANVARWNGRAGSPLGGGLAGRVFALAVTPAGEVIAGGRFEQSGSSNIARYSGGVWTPMGVGLGGAGDQVNAVHVLRDGRVLAGASNGVVAVWEGGVWQPVGSAFNGRVLCVMEDAHGGLYAGGDFTASGVEPTLRGAKWDGAKWVQLAFGFNDWIGSMRMQGGDLAVAGSFSTLGHPAGGYARLIFPHADFNGDGDYGTDQDIEAFFACIGGHCCPTCGSADFNADGDLATDQDIESFFRVLGGHAC